MLDFAQSFRHFLDVERSALGRPWRARLDSAGEAQAQAIAQIAGQSDLMARVLAGRGVKTDEVEKYLDPTIRDLVIDLRYRGDYTAKTREFVQPAVVKNDLKELAAVLADRDKWSSVPDDRFKRRAAYAKKALDARK